MKGVLKDCVKKGLITDRNKKPQNKVRIFCFAGAWFLPTLSPKLRATAVVWTGHSSSVLKPRMQVLQLDPATSHSSCSAFPFSVLF